VRTKQKPNYNDHVLKWPLPFRNAIKIDNDALGVDEFTIEGKTRITAKDLEQMKNDGYIFQRIDVYKIDSDLLTSVTFRQYQAPSLENGGRSDKKVLKKSKPQQTGIRVGALESFCCGDTVGPDNHQGDDMSL
jgi:hypothetical protein